MGDLAADTAVTQVGEGAFTAQVHPDWEIWGPMGGYVASLALRAAQAGGGYARPASFSAHYLGVAAFDEVQLSVHDLRRARTALSQRVEVRQGDRPIMEATVWSVGVVDGLTHDVAEAPDVPGPDELRPVEELLTDEDRARGPGFPFWQNLESRPVDWWAAPPTEPQPPVWRGWQRFRPAATFDDPWVDACRSLVLVDVQSWPAASRQHAGRPSDAPGYIAPSLDLYVAFADPQPGSAWLLADGYGPVARDGLMTWNGRLWSVDGRLVATGEGQLLCRRLPPTPA